MSVELIASTATAAAKTVVETVVEHPVAAGVVAGAVVVGLAAKAYKANSKKQAILKRIKSHKHGVVHLYSFPKASGYLNLGGPSLTVETFLRLHNIPYVHHFTVDATESLTTGRLPMAEVNGVQIADSAFIIEHLIKEFNIDEKLTAAQVAKGIAFRRILESSSFLHNYRATVVDHPESMMQIWKEVTGYPSFAVKKFVGDYRQKVIKMLNAHGHGDLFDEQYHAEFLYDIQAVEELLSGSEFAVGDKLTQYDAGVFAYLAAYRGSGRAFGEAECAKFPAYALLNKSKVINDYLQRVQVQLFPDAKELLATSAKQPFADQAFEGSN